MKTLRDTIRRLRSHREERRRIIETQGIFAAIRAQKGFVLVIVLLICAMLITVSGEFLIGAQNNISYMSNFKGEAQALELARSGVDMACFLLDQDKAGRTGSFAQGYNTSASVDSYRDLWAADFPEVPLENGTVKIVIRDEQSKINASILANEFGESRYYPIAKRLFESMGFLPDICDAIRDWVDPDSTKSPYGAETFDYYSTLPKPRSAKNGPLDSIDELLMIKGITPQIYYGLGGGNPSLDRDPVPDNMFIMPLNLDPSQNADTTVDMATVKIGREKSRALYDYFRAHGSVEFDGALNKINVNTASFRVLSALTANMSDATVTEFIRTRILHPFASVDEAAKALGVTGDDVTKYLSVSSDLFSIRATGSFAGQTVTVTAVYSRADKRYRYYGIQ